MSDWNQKDRDAVTHLWSTGMTAQKIATALFRTRASVLSFIKRNKLPQPKREPVKKTKVNPSVIINKSRTETKIGILPGEAIYASHKPGLMELGVRDCVYPIGDPKQDGFHFCGRKSAEKSMCIDHFRLCYPKNKN